jgi:hypothetical protein
MKLDICSLEKPNKRTTVQKVLLPNARNSRNGLKKENEKKEIT